MKKMCSKHGTYDYSSNGCPKCVQQADKQREQSHKRGYDSKWRKFREHLKQHFCYSFCWQCFLNEGKFNYDIHYHHIISLNEANDLKYSVNNLVPLCPRHHSEIESKVRANKEQPNWKEVRKLVEDELRSLGKIGD